jgi:magnesium chelatase family protein
VGWREEPRANDLFSRRVLCQRLFVLPMLAKIYSAAVYGVDAYEVEIEVNGARGEPKIIIVGLPDAAVKESRDRVTTAISNSGYYWPRGRTTINLAPADIKKEGPSFDLPIALGMIAVAQELEQAPFETFSFVGELALDGAVRPVKGVLPVALEARRQKKEAIFVPAANANEAAMVEGITVYGVRNLRETYQFVIRESLISPTYGDLTSFFATHKNYEVDFSDVKGQGHVKRAIEVAVAGGHNLLMLCNNYLKNCRRKFFVCSLTHFELKVEVDSGANLSLSTIEAAGLALDTRNSVAAVSLFLV